MHFRAFSTNGPDGIVQPGRSTALCRRNGLQTRVEPLGRPAPRVFPVRRPFGAISIDLMSRKPSAIGLVGYARYSLI